MKRDYQLLELLLQTPSPSGAEQDLLLKWWARNSIPQKDTCDTTKLSECYKDKLGQIGFSVGHGPIKIALTAHIDSVFARVNYVDKHGLIHLKHTGGTDRESFISGNVLVLTKNGPVHGIIGKPPIHIEKSQEKHDYDDLKDVVVNIGHESKDSVTDMGIIPGIPVIYDRNINLTFGEHRMHATELDDKIGVYIITKIMDALSMSKSTEWEDKYTVFIVPLCQEEVGGTGAIRVAKNINPDICFNFDVEHAQDYIRVKEDKAGDVELGNGGIIEYGCDKSQRIIDILQDVCETNHILYQTNASRNKGTDTVQFQTEASDCETMLISIPNIYMHTSVEVCDWRDVESIIEMVTKTIESCKL